MTPEQRKRLEDIVYSHVITSKLDGDVRAALAEIDRLNKLLKDCEEQMAPPEVNGI